MSSGKYLVAYFPRTKVEIGPEERDREGGGGYGGWGVGGWAGMGERESRG